MKIKVTSLPNIETDGNDNEFKHLLSELKKKKKTTSKLDSEEKKSLYNQLMREIRKAKRNGWSVQIHD